jgi:hypothetical protein
MISLAILLARSRHFDPNNKKQLERWAKEVKRVFAKYHGVVT